MNTANSTINNSNVTFFLYDHLGNTRVSYQAGLATNQALIQYAADYFPYGKILREFANGAIEKYLTTGHERDQETGLDYRGARYYDSDIARFLSVDPLAAKYVSWSTYNYVMGNPVMMIDPSGKGPEWIPMVKNGTITLKPEAGDDAKSLQRFLDVSEDLAQTLYNSKCSDGTVELGGDVPGIGIIQNAIADYKLNPDNYDGVLDRNYDCHESSLSLLIGEQIDYGNEIQGRDLSNELYRSGNYKDVTGNSESYKFGQTLIRFGNSAGNTTHSATYLGRSQDGTIYTWSKNGNSDKPAIFTVQELAKIYKSWIQGVGPEKGGGFYNTNY